jgi:hypothetical protein
LENLGVRTLIFKGLDDLEVCEGAGSQHDGMLACTAWKDMWMLMLV